jgi:ACS family glucarate transporter-like MFS transporter
MDSLTATQGRTTASRVRWMIVTMLFIVTAINYADRAALAIAGPAISRQFGIEPFEMGFIFSAFGWAYVIAQLPGGWILDRFGSKIVYAGSIFFWSIFTLLQGTVGFLSGGAAVAALFVLRFLVGTAEAPSFPGNSRVVAAWFPGHERATASAIFNSAQYFATVIFAPVMGWLTHEFGWPWVFVFMGVLGVVFAGFWLRLMANPSQHPWANQAEIDYIRAGGGLVSLDQKGRAAGQGDIDAMWDYIRQLFSNRMMNGLFLGQYCINTLTYFFITWFPVYLVQQRGMSILKAGFVASIPAICGFAGGVLGGIISDWMLKRGWSLTAARKTPIVGGMLLSMAMIGCNYTDSEMLVIVLMALSFFGKGIGALGWAVMSDAAPRQITGLAGGVFNMCGNLSSITTPIVIGLIVQQTGSFNGALVFIGANALVAALSYLVVVQKISRMELRA